MTDSGKAKKTFFSQWGPPTLLCGMFVAFGVFAFIIRRLPNKWFDEKVKMHYASRKELKFYEKLGVRTWKDKVPELGGFTSFHKDKIRDGDNPEYLKRFILECNYGAVIHLVTAILGFLIVFITKSSVFNVLNGTSFRPHY